MIRAKNIEELEGTIPYTYSLRYTDPDTNIKMIYYGSRYAEGCHPRDLLVTYPTSSKRIIDLLERYGRDFFRTEIRYIFPNDKVGCQIFEMKVIQRLRKRYREACANRGAPGAYSNEIGPNKDRIVIHHKEKSKQKMIPKDKLETYLEMDWELGVLNTDKKVAIHHSVTEKIIRVPARELNEYLDGSYIQGYPESSKEKYRQGQNKRWEAIPKDERVTHFTLNPPVGNTNGKGTVWYHDPKTQKQKRLKPEKISLYLERGWIQGQNEKTRGIHSERAKKITSSPDYVNPMESKDTRAKMRASVQRGYDEGRINFNKGKFGISSTRYGKEQTENQRKIAKEVNELDWEVTNPNGETFIIRNMNQFCKDNNLNSSNMSSVASGRLKHYKRWTCRKLIK